jgi:hypothetical protein
MAARSPKIFQAVAATVTAWVVAMPKISLVVVATVAAACVAE